MDVTIKANVGSSVGLKAGVGSAPGLKAGVASSAQAGSSKSITVSNVNKLSVSVAIPSKQPRFLVDSNDNYITDANGNRITVPW